MVMLKTTGIDHINLEVINLDESVKFYQQLLGFDVLEEFSEPKGKIIGIKQAKLALYETADLTQYHNSGFSHIGFHIENFDEAENQCQKMGLSIKYGGAVQWPKSRSIYITDPNGYEIELTEVWGGGLS
jgi:catechol 2,3-dioxygenase-like lactoylglutathione lyase family enzyme